MTEQKWRDENGELHRVGAPAHVSPGREDWYEHGELHREDGPASTTDGERRWAVYGEVIAQADAEEPHAFDALGQEDPDLLRLVLQVAREGDDVEKVIRSVRAARG